MFFANMQLVQSQVPEEFRSSIYSQEIGAKDLASVRCLTVGREPVLQKNHHFTITPITMTRVAAQKTFSGAVVYLGNLNKP
jgi:hypothetical protein